MRDLFAVIIKYWRVNSYFYSLFVKKSSRVPTRILVFISMNLTPNSILDFVPF